MAWSTSAQTRPAVDAHGVGRGVDRGGAHAAQVDDQRAVGDAQPGGVVPAAAHREFDAVLAGEVHAGDDVRGVRDPGDGRRAAVDHAVVDGTRRIVSASCGNVSVPRNDAASSAKGASVVSGCPLMVFSCLVLGGGA